MTTITRLIQLFKAVLHSIIDHLEDKRLLMKQGFRDMEEALVQKEARLKQLHACRDQVQHEEAEFRREIDALDQDTQAAIRKGKDELARLLLKRIQALTTHQEELENDIGTLKEQISQLQACLTNQQYRYQQLRLRADTYLRRTAQTQLIHTPFPVFPVNIREPSDEQIELELLQRKEALESISEVRNHEN